MQKKPKVSPKKAVGGNAQRIGRARRAKPRKK